MGMDFNEVAMEYTKIYFHCHPDQLPKDEEKAIKKLQHIHSFFKSKQIDSQTKKNQDFFKDTF